MTRRRTVKLSAADRRKLLDPEGHPVLSVEEARAIYGLSETTFYEALRRGDVPNRRIGSRYVIPTAQVRRHLGLDQAEEVATS